MMIKLVSQSSRLNESSLQQVNNTPQNNDIKMSTPKNLTQLNQNNLKSRRRNQSVGDVFSIFPNKNDENFQTPSISKENKISTNGQLLQSKTFLNLLQIKQQQHKPYSPSEIQSKATAYFAKNNEELLNKKQDMTGYIQSELNTISNKQQLKKLFNHALKRSSTTITEPKIMQFKQNLPQLYHTDSAKQQQQKYTKELLYSNSGIHQNNNSGIQFNNSGIHQKNSEISENNSQITSKNNGMQGISRTTNRQQQIQNMRNNFHTQRYQSSLERIQENNNNINNIVQRKQNKNSRSQSVISLNLQQFRQQDNSKRQENMQYSSLAVARNSQQQYMNNRSRSYNRMIIPSISTGISTNTNHYSSDSYPTISSINNNHSTRQPQSIVKQIDQSNFIGKYIIPEYTYNHNFTQKKKLKFQPQGMLALSDSQIPLFSSSKPQIYGEESYTYLQNGIESAPEIKHLYTKKEINIGNRSQLTNTIKDHYYQMNEYPKQSNIYNIGPASLVDFDIDTQPKQLKQSGLQQNQLSFGDLMSAYTQGDKQQQNQIHYKKELLKTVQNSIPKYLKQKIQKYPEYFEIIMVCNNDSTFDIFCDKMGKFVSYCIDQTSVKVSSFNSIRMSLGLSECLLLFLQEFFMENNMNKLFYNQFCDKYREYYQSNNLKTGNLLLEIGGKKRLEVLVSNIIEKLEKLFDMKLRHKINTIVEFGVFLLIGNMNGVADKISDFYNEIATYGGIISASMCTAAHFFRLKYLIYLELHHDKDIPWKIKVYVLNEFEKLRYKYFRQLHGITDSVSFLELAQKINKSMCELHWIKLGFLSKQSENRLKFLFQLVKMVIEGDDGFSLRTFLDQNHVIVNTETIYVLESLVKGVINQEKILPMVTKKDFDYKFQKIKKILGLEASYSYLIQNIDGLYNEVQKQIQLNNKLNRIPSEQAKIYENLDYFFLLLISSCDDNCMFHLSDSQYAQDILKIDQQSIQQQCKALKRVLISQHIKAGNTESSKYLTDINLMITNMLTSFTDYKIF